MRINSKNIQISESGIFTLVTTLLVGFVAALGTLCFSLILIS